MMCYVGCDWLYCYMRPLERWRDEKDKIADKRKKKKSANNFQFQPFSSYPWKLCAVSNLPSGLLGERRIGVIGFHLLDKQSPNKNSININERIDPFSCSRKSISFRSSALQQPPLDYKFPTRITARCPLITNKSLKNIASPDRIPATAAAVDGQLQRSTWSHL